MTEDKTKNMTAFRAALMKGVVPRRLCALEISITLELPEDFSISSMN